MKAKPFSLTPLGVMLTPMLKWGAMSDKQSRWGS